MPSERLTYFAVIRERGGPWDWSRAMEEQDLWPEHARFMDDLVADGFLILGGPLEDGRRVLHIVDAESAEAVHLRFAPDPWTENGMLTTASVELWEIRLDGRD